MKNNMALLFILLCAFTKSFSGTKIIVTPEEMELIQRLKLFRETQFLLMLKNSGADEKYVNEEAIKNLEKEYLKKFFRRLNSFKKSKI